MSIRAALVIVLVVFSNLLLWIAQNQPASPEAVRYPVMGLSYNPYQRDQGPWRGGSPSAEDIDRDMQVLSTRTKSVRIYRASEGFEQIPDIAKNYGLSVILSAYLSGDADADQKEVDAAIQLAGRSRHVSRLIIGNETQLQGSVPREQLVKYLRGARKRLRTPVSTAEPWDFWLNHPEVASEVDFIAIHILPYWKEVPIEHAVDYVLEKYEAVKSAFPHKRVVIAETGWPSDGPTKGAAQATQINQALFIREFLLRISELSVPYNLIEAFDQPWKSALEGRAGEHWGIMDATRHEKFPLIGPVLEDPLWRAWAVSSTILGAIIMGAYFVRRRTLSLPGEVFVAVMTQLVVSCCVALAHQAAGEYFSVGDVAFWTVMVAAQAILAVLFLTDTAEIGDVVGDRPLKYRYPPSTAQLPNPAPFVSLHLACCREPPELVIKTLESLAKLSYPQFEVVVVDNNTLDDSLWRPVEKRCKELGSRFRFYSLGKWPGFKAGALNFALRVTNPQAEVIGVVDADYLVDPTWLAATIPYFDDQQVAVVQAPQEHRGYSGSLFQMMENDEYSGFFRIGMVQRNEDNAIIQHGTMTLIRRGLLDDLDGWSEWCICEDAELGLRLLCKGKKNIYIDHVFGRGLVPDSYEAYAKQRFRWAYGGMRIMRHYWKELLGVRPDLTPKQRYQFIKGWLPWLGDALHMFFTGAALIWTARLLYDPLQTDFPEKIFVFPALALVFLRIAGTAVTYAKRVRIGHHRTLLAMVAGGSLTHTVAKAVLQGLFTNGVPFYRTPKMAQGMPVLRSLVFVYQELMLALLLCVGAVGVVVSFGTVNDDAVVWAIALVIQAFPYFAAVTASVLAGLPLAGTVSVEKADDYGEHAGKEISTRISAESR